MKKLYEVDLNLLGLSSLLVIPVAFSVSSAFAFVPTTYPRDFEYKPTRDSFELSKSGQRSLITEEAKKRAKYLLSEKKVSFSSSAQLPTSKPLSTSVRSKNGNPRTSLEEARKRIPNRAFPYDTSKSSFNTHIEETVLSRVSKSKVSLVHAAVTQIAPALPPRPVSTSFTQTPPVLPPRPVSDAFAQTAPALPPRPVLNTAMQIPPALPPRPILGTSTQTPPALPPRPGFAALNHHGRTPHLIETQTEASPNRMVSPYAYPGMYPGFGGNVYNTFNENNFYFAQDQLRDDFWKKNFYLLLEMYQTPFPKVEAPQLTPSSELTLPLAYTTPSAEVFPSFQFPIQLRYR